MYDQLMEAAGSANAKSAVEIKKVLYKLWGEGVITDEQAATVETLLLEKTTVKRERPERKTSIFPPKRRPVPYDRQKSLLRRRKMVGFGWMPADMQKVFSEAERSAIYIIAEKFHKHGVCDAFMGRIAAEAGVSESTVRLALKKAVRLGLISVEYRKREFQPNLSNLVRIIDRSWLSWLKNRGEGSNTSTPRKSQDFKGNLLNGNEGSGSRRASSKALGGTGFGRPDYLAAFFGSANGGSERRNR